MGKNILKILAEREKKEHPWATRRIALRIAKDHLVSVSPQNVIDSESVRKPFWKRK